MAIRLCPSLCCVQAGVGGSVGCKTGLEKLTSSPGPAENWAGPACGVWLTDQRTFFFF